MTTVLHVGMGSGVKIRRALGPMARKIACGPSKLTPSGPDSDTVIGSINEIRKSGPLKDCEGPNGPWQFYLF